MSERQDFYVGYLERAPASIAAFLRPRTLLVAALLMSIGVGLLASQSAFSSGVFEFGRLRDFEGRIEAAPYPVLAIDRPGGGSSRYLLCAEGKHGADALVAKSIGRRVRLRGTLIHRECMTMVEIEEGSITALDGGTEAQPDAPTARIELSSTTLRGEIVDSKCHLGVMKPGEGKAHRDCAARCLSGGVPPMLYAIDQNGRTLRVLLSGAGGEAIGRKLLDFVGEPVEISGALSIQGDLYQMRIDPLAVKRLN